MDSSAEKQVCHCARVGALNTFRVDLRGVIVIAMVSNWKSSPMQIHFYILLRRCGGNWSGVRTTDGGGVERGKHQRRDVLYSLALA